MRFEFFDALDSTNEEARRRALSGESGPLWIIAKTQSTGRGRRGRAWTSKVGNLFATGLYRLQAVPSEAARLSFAAALAAGDVAASVAGQDRVRLKWPNDVLVEGGKVAGLLLESGDHPAGGLWLAVGIGINLAHHPADAERPATDLSVYAEPLALNVAAERLALRFEHWRKRWEEEGFAALRDAWLARAHGLGERCMVRLHDETLEGVFTDLDETGALRLELNDGRRRLISAGDVFFPTPSSS